ncbi:YpzG family protein [Fervidibacillus albus]|uniref:YpzG family protein n=1 Tax=Fervidibacillus albus TaxID=2980026 RepID=A0A9E8LTG9_9BACI|nr:YpzG family protein [Fervidibacillus albus]WAA09323.1 YpzG family protein [Fervidibacillus albus]
MTLLIFRADPTSKFRQTWTRPKKGKSQINGQTELTQSDRILRSNAKAHRW